MPYDSILVQPMRDELTRMGVAELRTPAEVDAFLSDGEGTALLFVNSVCGCAAGSARPALGLALADARRPARVATVFAGQDVEATAHARSRLAGYQPSSPSVYLLRDGEVVMHLPRQGIEGRTAAEVASVLVAAFAENDA
jgi:putative YphP/YqiW family bacilliredoxin